MRTDLSQATFIIPIRIESTDRLRNVVTTTAFLMENFDTNIIIKEVDNESVFQKEAIPLLEEILDINIWQNFNYIFEKSDEPLFHRLKVLNECKEEFDVNLKLLLDVDFYHRMRMKNGMPNIIPNILVANRDHDDRISSQATSQYDCVVEHPEGNWMMNSRELHYIHQKYPDFMINPKYPDES